MFVKKLGRLIIPAIACRSQLNSRLLISRWQSTAAFDGPPISETNRMFTDLYLFSNNHVWDRCGSYQEALLEYCRYIYSGRCARYHARWATTQNSFGKHLVTPSKQVSPGVRHCCWMGPPRNTSKAACAANGKSCWNAYAHFYHWSIDFHRF